MSIPSLVNGLPYIYKMQVISSAAAFDQAINTLRPSVGDLVDSRGTCQRLLYFNGTIPITIQGVTYHIPVNMWLPLNFPQMPPICYVTPTATMFIKPRHQHVDLQGMVYLPYLHAWNTASTLGELVTWMQSTFEKDCPVLSKAAAPVVRPQPEPQPQAGMWQAGLGVPVTRSMAGSGSSIPIARPIASSSSNSAAVSPGVGDTHLSRITPHAYQPPPYQPPKSKSEMLMPVITQKLGTHLSDLYRGTAEEIDLAFQQQRQITDAKSRLENSMQALQQEKESLTSLAAKLTEEAAFAQTWIQEQEGAKEISIDDLVCPKDTWAQQMLEAVAEDHAIEDAMDELQKSLRDEKIEIGTFLKCIRKLARKQFMARALALKIHEAQRNAAGH
eukprot:gb/GEZN01006015.1/.p1 GENE.gb/GEZN01006015.1/~~gb/GEZN01006015.1/.p1  ORF type:complete len:387 (+),score=80.06 gb/GEZN01006015.1/:86-1246(+)